MINSTQMFEKFKERNPGTDVNYALFRYILSEYNKGIVDTLLKGEVFNLGARLGKLKIRRIQRSFKKKIIDWGETNKLIAKGINQFVYFTDDYYYGFFWEKKSCVIKNKSVYKFKIAGGQNGPKRLLINFLRDNEFNKLNFNK